MRAANRLADLAFGFGRYRATVDDDQIRQPRGQRMLAHDLTLVGV